MSDTFKEHHAKLLCGEDEYAGVNPYKGRIYDPACGSGAIFASCRHSVRHALREKETCEREEHCPVHLLRGKPPR